MTERFAIILAAGKGTRMKSPRPKVLHEVGGRPMLAWSVALARDLGCSRTVVVVGPDFPEVSEAAAALVGAESVCVQRQQLGTANAVDAARDILANAEGNAIVLYADTPLIPVEACERALKQVEAGASVCVLGFETREPGRYGRLVTLDDGSLGAIVEANDATEEQLQITLCNSGVMAAPAKLMFELLTRVDNNNAKGEYYLTDLVGLVRADGRKAALAKCKEADVQGVNSQVELASAEAEFQQRKRREMMVAGVTMRAPETVYFSWDTQVGAGTVIDPNVVFGLGVTVEGGAWIKSFCHFEKSKIGPDAEVGPFARLRPGADIRKGAHVGNFVELKNTILGEGSKASHLSYLGDGVIGAKVNIGAGTIFCNYDGYFKYRTTIGDGAFIGSNTALVAPVTVGAGGYTGSGSVITDDIPEDALGLGRARQADNKAGWAKTFRETQIALKSKGKKPDGAV
ncbi:MAG: bifunctional UDP-N-acetylglucosamine diphosphorylase/glucosamine-1-phosphate N-acetyltransferase GlmU [Hyphomonadaceae bacterium]